MHIHPPGGMVGLRCPKLQAFDMEPLPPKDEFYQLPVRTSEAWDTSQVWSEALHPWHIRSNIRNTSLVEWQLEDLPH